MRGVYVLIIQVDENIDVNVGVLGKLTFEKGFYAYVGSAQTSLESRIRRHLRKEKRLFWHIDYLLDDSAGRIVKVLYKQANRIEECNLAKAIGEMGEPVDGFGCSDCSCKSHLFRIRDYRILQGFMEAVPVQT